MPEHNLLSELSICPLSLKCDTPLFLFSLRVISCLLKVALALQLTMVALVVSGRIGIRVRLEHFEIDNLLTANSQRHQSIADLSLLTLKPFYGHRFGALS